VAEKALVASWQHRARLHSINPFERLDGEIKRRNEAVGAILLHQNDEWAVRRARSVTPDTIAPVSHDSLVSLPAAGA
jgi:putative transposase